MSTELVTDVPEYDADTKVHAFRSTQGQRTVYTTRLTINMALDLLPRPDPAEKFPNNRPIEPKHSQEFGDYWEKNPIGWGCPAGLISVRSDFENWTAEATGNAMTAGVLGLPRELPSLAEILDMQHRLYGFHLKRSELAERLRKALEQLSDAERLEDQKVIDVAQAKVDDIRTTLKRMNTETIAVEILVMSEKEHRTLFAQIADKALKISNSQIADYDSTQVINRVARALADKHPLLQNRVDWIRNNVTDTVKKANPNLISGETLVNIVRPFATGDIVGRVSTGRNTELEAEEAALTGRVTGFLDAIEEAFSDIADVEVGELTPADLRANSLLGSRTILRVLAAAYHDLTTDRISRRAVKPQMTPDEVTEFFKTLQDDLRLPLERDSRWFTDTQSFPPLPAEDTDADLPRAPMSRSQDLKNLVKSIEQWAAAWKATNA